MTTILLAIVCGPVLWLVGAIGFDGVHWALHRMLASRFRVLRTLAWPHAVHHRWIDRELNTSWELRSANCWCHIVPEYLTQLLFTGALALVLPAPFAAVVFVLQTALFLGILKDRGRDINHRPAARIDAHRPGWTTPPAYHALHHAWPDAYFSAYTKAVDWLVGGGAQIAGRRFAFVGSASSESQALQREIERLGGDTCSADAVASADADVVVLTDESAPVDGPTEQLIDATRERQLPPELWALRRGAEDAYARHYRDDPRVVFRTLALGGRLRPERAARHALFWVRRDAHFVAAGEAPGGRAWRRFRALHAVVPPGARTLKTRLELLPASLRTGPERPSPAR